MGMNVTDFPSLFRLTLGFAHSQHLFDPAAQRDEKTYTCPPYNIEVTSKNAYRITIAVAGFSRDNLDITTKENSLVAATKSQQNDANKTYLLRGIAGRFIERRFALADHIKVTGALLVNGLLHIDLVREVPEEKKARIVEIFSQRIPTSKNIEQKAA
jgi:molecular chaperone IbpA